LKSDSQKRNDELYDNYKDTKEALNNIDKHMIVLQSEIAEIRYLIQKKQKEQNEHK